MEVRDRIKKIIEMENISQAEFSRITGINTSTLSHVLTGRNNPSMDVINKILATYTKYSSSWLINGEGEPLDESKDSSDFSNHPIYDRYSNDEGPVGASPKTLFEEQEAPNFVNDSKPDFSNYARDDSYKGTFVTPSKEPAIENLILSKSSNNAYHEQKIEPQRVKVKRIIVYYDDNTFESFIPEKESK